MQTAENCPGLTLKDSDGSPFIWLFLQEMTQHWKIRHFVIFPHLAQKLGYCSPNFQSEIPTVLLLLLLLFGWLVLSFFFFFSGFCLFIHFVLSFSFEGMLLSPFSVLFHVIGALLDVGCSCSLVKRWFRMWRVGWLCCEPPTHSDS